MQAIFIRTFTSLWHSRSVGCPTKTQISIYLSLACIVSFSGCVQPDNNIVPDAEVVTHRGITYQQQKPFTGKTFRLNSQGDTISRITYENGKIHGPDYAWYSFNIKKHERYYTQGKKDGVHVGWWPNGQMKFRYEFTDDEYEGSVNEWYEDGTPYRSFTYSKGHEDGPQKMWRPDGSIYANYVLKDNRIYGLSGRKNCKSLWKS